MSIYCMIISKEEGGKDDGEYMGWGGWMGGWVVGLGLYNIDV